MTSNGANGTHDILHDETYVPPYKPTNERPKNVGIHAMEMYFPSRCISEAELEQFDGVSAGKYTVGLGQEHMAFVDDREDIHSMLLSVTSSLLKKYNIDPRAIGRIDVGTETIIDKSKSAKTVLMDLFIASGNSDIEGIDSKNACYGGTAALFNAVNWVESSSWDGRYALAVSGDIAVYAAGPARPAGGAGAIALLIGPDAPLVLEPGRSTFMANYWDFYKPALASEYPEVDGPLTLVAYFSALQEVYGRFKQKSPRNESLHDFDYVCFHGPFGKQVQKAFARMTYIDFLASPQSPRFASVDQTWAYKRANETLTDKNLEKTFIDASKAAYKQKVWPTTAAMRRLGNTYTASLYCCLASLVDSLGSDLKDKRIGMFSYGSGLASSFFSIAVKGDCSKMQEALGLEKRFAGIKTVPCEDLVAALNLREEKHNIHDYTPTGSIENIAPGAYYLEHCDAKGRRKYAQAA